MGAMALACFLPFSSGLLQRHDFADSAPTLTMNTRCQLPLADLPRLIAGALLLCLAGVLTAAAQPSGGPYGPVQQRYEVPVAAHVYYVAPGGSADATGAALDQATTLEAAIARVVTGDAIVLRGGTYRTGGLALNQGVTLQPYADERPVLNGTEVATEWTALPDGRWRTSWTKLFPAAPADWWNRARFEKQTPVVLFNNDMVFIDGELLGAVGTEQEVTAKSYFINYEAGQVTIGTNPQGRLVEITARDSALTRTIRDVHGRANDRRGPVIRGITFTQYAYRALEVEGTEPGQHMDPSQFGKEVVGTTLENVTISFCSRVAGYFRGDGLVIRNCLVADCGTEGLYVIDSADILLERNIVTRTNRAEKIAGYFASAVKIFNQCYRATCRDNLVIDNPDASGVWYDVGEVDGVFVNNWVERANEGFFFEISKGAICAGNVFVNCVNGVKVLNSSNAQVYQNTCYNSPVVFGRTQRSAVGDHFGWHPSAGPGVEERHGHVLANNLMVADEKFPGPLLQVFQNPQVRHLRDSQLKEADGNVYVRRAGAKPQPLAAWSPAANEQDSAEAATLDDLRKMAPPFEAAARVYPDYWGRLFLSVELRNFQLARAFPGADAGVPLPAAIRDLLQWRSDSAAFPGAYPPK